MSLDLYNERAWIPRPQAHFHDWDNGAFGPLLGPDSETYIATGRFAYCRVDECGAMIFVGHLDDTGELVAQFWHGPDREVRERIDARFVAGFEEDE